MAEHQKLLDSPGRLPDFTSTGSCWPTGSSQPLGRGSGWRGDLTPCSSTKTGYWALDERIGLTRLPRRPPTGDGAWSTQSRSTTTRRNLTQAQRVRKRKISFGPRVAEGTRAWDTWPCPLGPLRKLGVTSRYINDRISGANQIPQLSSIIEERAKELNLGASWPTA